MKNLKNFIWVITLLLISCTVPVNFDDLNIDDINIGNDGDVINNPNATLFTTVGVVWINGKGAENQPVTIEYRKSGATGSLVKTAHTNGLGVFKIDIKVENEQFQYTIKNGTKQSSGIAQAGIIRTHNFIYE